MSDPFLPPSQWLSGTNQNSIPANDNALRFEITQRNVNNATTAQPASPTEGDTYIIQSTHTGAQWSTFTPKDVAIFKGGTWKAFAPSEGMSVSVAGVPYIYTSGTWTAAGGSGGMSNPMTTAGDLVYGGTPSGGVAPPTRLGVGTNGYVLTVAAGLPVWAAVPAGFTNPMSAVGDLIVGGTSGAATSLAAGTSTYVLTSNGPGAAPSWQAAGGGAVTGFTGSLNTSGINSTINVSRLLASGGSTNQDAAFSPKGTGAVLAQLPDGTTAGGNKRGTNSVDLQTSRSAATYVAQSSNSVIVGGANNTASATYAFVGAGDSNVASGSYATVPGGFQNTASGVNATVTGGRENVSSGLNSRCAGNGGNARSIQGADVFGMVAGNQRANYGLQRYTTTATPATATVDYNATAVATNQLTLSNNMAISFTALVVAKRQSSTDSAHWKIEGAIVRGGSAGTTALVGTPTVTSLGAAAGASTWAVAATADTTIGCLSFQVTGQASANINWTIAIQAAEVVL